MNFLKRQQGESFVFGTTLAEIAFIMFFLLIIISSHKEIGFEADREVMQEEIADVSDENTRLNQEVSATESENANLRDENNTLSRANDRMQEENKRLQERIRRTRQVMSAERYDLVGENTNLENENYILTQANDRIRGENQELRAELAKIRDGSGDAPGRKPCWRERDNENGDIQPLYEVVIHEGFLSVDKYEKSWGARQVEVADAMFLELIGRHDNREEFKDKARNLDERTRGIDCVHYIIIYDKSDTKEEYKSWKKSLDGVFYPYLER